MFKDLRPGSSVYMFDHDTATFTEAKVINVTAPYYDNHYGNPLDKVVDVTLEGFKAPYTFKETSDTGHDRNTVISTDKNKVLREVAMLKSQSEQALANRENYEQCAKRCSEILAKHDPVFKQNHDTEERFTRIEGSVEEMKEMVRKLIEAQNK